MVTTPITAAGLLVNRQGGWWSGRIVDAAIAQALAEAGLHDLRDPPLTSTCRCSAALAALQDEPAPQIQSEKNE